LSKGGFAVTSPYFYLLDDPDFRRFIQNVRRRSENSASGLLRRFGAIHKRFQKLPRDFTKMDTKQAKRFELDMVDDFEDEGGEDGEELAGSYIQTYVKAVNRWLEFSEITPPRKVFAEGADESLLYENEVPPTPDELGSILEQADFRARAALGLVAFSGVRIQVLGKKTRKGYDGLKVKDLPEMVIKGDTVEFQRIPTLLVVRKSLSKIRRKYTSFVCSEGAEYVRAYLEWRMRRLHQKLTPNSPIIVADIFHPQHQGKHMRTTNVSDLMRKPIRAAKFEWRPYVLRRYADVRLDSAKFDRLIDPDWRTYWMGHKGSIEFVYTYAKGLPDETIEKMREGYKKAAEKFLTTRTKKEETDEDKVLAMINRRFLSWAGYADEEIEKLGDLSKLTEQQMQDLIDKKSAGSLQKIVPIAEVKEWVIKGWLFVQALPDNEAVIRRPFRLHSGLLQLGVDHLKPNLAFREAIREGEVVGFQQDQFTDRTV